MVQGMYTSVSGMIAQQHRLDAIANNLANASTSAYKRELSIDKAFPELLIRKTDVETLKFPYRLRPSVGSIDKSPVVGKVGTGVEQNELYTVFEQGPLRETGNPTDLALHGEGFFVVDTPYGERYTRNGNFILGNGDILMTKEGFPVKGEKGYIRLQTNNFKIDKKGQVFVNASLDGFVDINDNDWRNTELLDRLRIVDVDRKRYLQKQGDSLYSTTEFAGELRELDLESVPVVNQHFIETSNVEPIRQMVEMIEVNRAYEAGQKAIQASDQSTERLLNIRL